MGRISEEGRSLERSAIRLFLEEQTRIAGTCGDMISFTVGEPDFPTPPNIVEAGMRALKTGKTKYAPNAGIPELKRAVSEYLKRDYGVYYDSQTQILITPSGMDTLRLAAAAVLDREDEMIVSDPCWSNHPNHPKMVHGRPVFVPLREENSFVYAMEDLEAAVTDRTKAILLNYPNNPTGAVLGYEDLMEFCDFCKRHDLIVISDEVYHDIIFDGLKFYSPTMIEGMKERVILCQSFSKSFSMTGWRPAYAAGPADLIDAMGRINENSISCVNTFVQWAGIEALNSRTKKYVESMVSEFQKRRDLVYQGINGTGRLRCAKPRGAFYAFVNIRDTGLSSEEFAQRLLKEKHVGVVPGSGFGMSGEGYIRISYATSAEDIHEGLRRIREFVDRL